MVHKIIFYRNFIFLIIINMKFNYEKMKKIVLIFTILTVMIRIYIVLKMSSIIKAVSLLIQINILRCIDLRINLEKWFDLKFQDQDFLIIIVNNLKKAVVIVAYNFWSLNNNKYNKTVVPLDVASLSIYVFELIRIVSETYICVLRRFVWFITISCAILY